MPISKKQIVSVSNSAVANSGSKPIELMQAAEATKAASQTIFTVATTSALPSVSENKGRLAWVSDIEEYRYSDGLNWLSDLGSYIYYNYSIWSWGANAYGFLGDSTTVSKSSPVSVVGGFTDWCRVDASDSHTLALRSNCTLWAWGCNGSGVVGDGTNSTRSSPVSVVGGFTDWCGISAGEAVSAALRTNGTIWTWGPGSAGQLGNNSSLNRSSPVSVVGGFTDWVHVAAGDSFVIGLRGTGVAWAWGYNNCGQLGDNSIVTKSSPVSVVGGFTDWCQVSGGLTMSAAIRTNGTLWTWGRASFGSLGDNSTAAKSSPVSVVGGFTDWCQVTMGRCHTLAIRTNGTLWAWGYNGQGQLGDGTTVSKSSPVSVVGGFTDWCQVSNARYHTLAVRTNGTAWAWGSGSNGILGTNCTSARSSPVSVVGGFTDWCQVSAANNMSVAIRKQEIGF